MSDHDEARRARELEFISMSNVPSFRPIVGLGAEPPDAATLKKMMEEYLSDNRRYLSLEIRSTVSPIVPPKFPITPGLYRLYWSNEAGAGTSLAAVGHDEKGNLWFAPTNWVGGVPCFDWSGIDVVEAIRTVLDEYPPPSRPANADLVEPTDIKVESLLPTARVELPAADKTIWDAAKLFELEAAYKALGIPKRIFEGRMAGVDTCDERLKGTAIPKPIKLPEPKHPADDAVAAEESISKPAGYKHKTLDEIIGECQKGK